LELQVRIIPSFFPLVNYESEHFKEVCEIVHFSGSLKSCFEDCLILKVGNSSRTDFLRFANLVVLAV
jgi:hypothetical protein